MRSPENAWPRRPDYGSSSRPGNRRAFLFAGWALGEKDDLPGSLAAFEVTVSLLDVSQRVFMSDAQFQSAFFDCAQDIIGSRLQLMSGCDVIGQRGACEE